MVAGRTVARFATAVWMQILFSFIQSRIACEAPILEGGEFTSSAYCGDRLKVLDGVSRLGALMRMVASLSFALSMAPCALLRDLMPRRSYAIAQSGVTLVAWVLQAGVAWAPPSRTADMLLCIATFVGPFLQLGGLDDILYDTAQTMDAESRTRFLTSDHTCQLVAAICGRLLGLWFNSLQITDFAAVVTALAVLRGVVLVITMCVPEVKVQASAVVEKTEERSVLPSPRRAWQMCRETFVALWDEPLFFWSAIETVFSGMAVGAQTMQAPLLMAKHPSLTIVFRNKVQLFSAVAVLPCPALGSAMSRRYGLRRCILFGEVSEFVLALGGPVFCMLFAEPYIAASDAITSMIGALQAAPQSCIEHNKPHMRSELRGRASAVLGLLKDLTTAVSSYWLARSVDVSTISNESIVRVWLLFYAFYCVEKVLWWRFQWPFFGEQADGIEKDLHQKAVPDELAKGGKSD